MSDTLGQVRADSSAQPVIAAVVLAGGQARRFGSDKLAAPVHGSMLLERAIAHIPCSWWLVVVGPPRDLSAPHIVASEDPPGAGPAAGLVAGARAAQRVGATTMVALPGDAPEGGAAAVMLVRALHQQLTGVASTTMVGSGVGQPAGWDHPPDVSAVVAIDEEQCEQPLHIAVTGASFQRLAALEDASDCSARRLLGWLGGYRTVRLPPRLLVDLDTPQQAAAWKSP